MNKKLLIGVVVIALGVGGYILYKRSKPSRKMFDEMVSNCKAPCDVFSGVTQSKLDKLFKEFQKLNKKDAQFMVDYIGESNKNASDDKRFTTLYTTMVKSITTA
mgnify:CR=1 FL=1